MKTPVPASQTITATDANMGNCVLTNTNDSADDSADSTDSTDTDCTNRTVKKSAMKIHDISKKDERSTIKTHSHHRHHDSKIDDDEQLQIALAMSMSMPLETVSDNKSNVVISKHHDDKSWICPFCNAMNRLLDTLTVFNIKCAVCKQQTYIPGITPLLMSFEWDHPVSSHYNTNKRSNKKLVQHITHKRNRTVHCESGTKLLYGLIRQCFVTMLFEDGLIKLILFYIDLFRVPWDMDDLYRHNKRNKGTVILDKHLLCLRRTYGDKGCFQNVFGSAIVSAPGHEWILEIEKIRNKGTINSVAIGIIDVDGISKIMGAPFHFYNDAYWKYFDEGIVRITIRWIEDNTKCELLFNGKVCYILNPTKEYRLAVALKEEGHILKCIIDVKT